MPFSPTARLAALALAAAAFTPGLGASPAFIAFVGTGTEAQVNGIYAFRYDEGEGTLEPLGVVARTPHPSFLAISPNGRCLYAANEADLDHSNGHTVTAFAVEGEGPGLKLLDVVPCGGDRPAHISVDTTGSFAFVSDYGSGTLAALPIGPDGALQSPAYVFQDPQPHSSNPRQQNPHAHAAYVDPSDRFLYCCDLGADRVMIYRFDAAAGSLVRNTPDSVEVPVGSGPRHLSFSPDGGRVYLANEIASTLIVFDRNPDDGSLTPRQTLSTLPPGWHGTNTAAEIQTAPSGRFVYVSNRGDDTIAVFAVGRDGSLSLAEAVPCGREPRCFTLDPAGTHLLALDQGGDAIRVFRVDPATGRLTDTGHRATADMPVTLVFGHQLP